MLRKFLVAGHAHGCPMLFKIQVEVADEEVGKSAAYEKAEKAAKFHEIAGPYIVFDVENDCSGFDFLNFESERVWGSAPIFFSND